MGAAVLSIGTEITRGEIVNTNSSWLAGELTSIGFEVTEIATVDDDIERIVTMLDRLARTHQVVVCTGGLGPTTDDLTAPAVARAVGRELVLDLPSLEAIKRRFEAAGRIMSPSNEKQAYFPAGADVLANPIGTAPGFAVSLHGTTAYFMPGVPREAHRMFADHVAPRVAPLAPNLWFQVRLKTFGAPESIVGERLTGIEEAFAGITLGYRAHFPEIEVKVRAQGSSYADARALAERAAEQVRGRLGDVLYGEGDDTFPRVVGGAIRARGWLLAIAESCTGGLVGTLLTQEPASDYFVADTITYANSAKTGLLGVGEEILRGHGAVSPECAAAMAEGIRRVCNADLGLAITGIAGPSGGTPEKPVGLVYWALAHPEGTIVRDRIFRGDRNQIQKLASFAAMALVREFCLASG
jgi:nicotinamide-nucleotide amidase